MDLEIVPLTSQRLGDLAGLFDEGGDPKWCQCAYFHVRGLSWQTSTRETNRALLAKRTRDEARPPGLVAYREGRAVGWVNVGPRPAYERLEHSKLLGPLDDRPTWSIVCFVVSRTARGSGVAAALLAAAVSFATEHGAERIEGYPADPGEGRIPAASAYQGTLSMFEKAGFEVVERRQWNRTSPIRPIVRRELGPG